ncbi:MAG: hypothetical protein JWP35_317 [Caulobacter sp.]|nr:hypothetical protein [Caulobacter sp.]
MNHVPLWGFFRLNISGEDKAAAPGRAARAMAVTTPGSRYVAVAGLPATHLREKLSTPPKAAWGGASSSPNLRYVAGVSPATA